MELRGELLGKYGTLTVSSVHEKHPYKSKMFDNDPKTFWHSNEKYGGDLIRYVFNNEQIVSMISIIRRSEENQGKVSFFFPH